jgi:recombination protein RecT
MESPNNKIELYENYKKIVSYGQSPEVLKAFRDVLGHEAPAFIQSAITAVKMDERLQQCTPRSIFNSALRAATLRLSCDPAIGHAYLIPYNNKGKMEAQFQVGWKGIQHMALRTGKYQYINVSKVYDGEEVVEDRITGELRITGQMKSPKRDIGLIASFGLTNGYRKSIFMTYEELEEHGKRYSKSYKANSPESIWVKNKELAYHKTILLKLLRTYGYLEPAEAAMLDGEEEDEENIDLELPSEDKVTIIDEPKYNSIAEINKALGYEEDDDNDDLSSFRMSSDEVIDSNGTEQQKTTESAYGTAVDKKAFKTKAADNISKNVITENVTKSKPVAKRPYAPEDLKKALVTTSTRVDPATDKDRQVLAAVLSQFTENDDQRHKIQKYLFDSDSIKNVSSKMIAAAILWLDPQYDAENKEYTVPEVVIDEIESLINIL